MSVSFAEIMRDTGNYVAHPDLVRLRKQLIKVYGKNNKKHKISLQAIGLAANELIVEGKTVDAIIHMTDEILLMIALRYQHVLDENSRQDAS